VTGDMRDMPFDDGEFGAIVSLGAVEHSGEGPMCSLHEFRRVLRPGGIAIITVPFLGPVRKWSRFVNAPRMAFSHNVWLRHLLGKSDGGSKTINEARREAIAATQLTS